MYQLFIPFDGQIVLHHMNVPHLCVRSLADGHLTFLSHTAVSTGVEVSTWTYILISFGCISRRGMAGPQGNSIFNQSSNWSVTLSSLRHFPLMTEFSHA